MNSKHRHHSVDASVLARINQTGIPMRVDRINDSLCNADG